MVGGFNHNFRYKGEMYHVQTEDGGRRSPNIITLLYKGGTILGSKKTSYADISKVDNLEQVVEELMKEQHKEMLRALKEGEYDEIIGGRMMVGTPPEAPVVRAPAAVAAPAPPAPPRPAAPPVAAPPRPTAAPVTPPPRPAVPPVPPRDRPPLPPRPPTPQADSSCRARHAEARSRAGGYGGRDDPRRHHPLLSGGG
ncbi:hypothetical protein [Desulfuromonas soudanensis]|uniref:hypothetical protein n=1 Tax=Desulfuromonas soudanensis TaxID=1603606 RepID=UPI001E4A5843|nr:hypothetical protein [Desulfuromonas soudanensis]